MNGDHWQRMELMAPVEGEMHMKLEDEARDDNVGTLTATVRKAAILSAGMLIFVQVVSLLQVLVVARILSPLQVGVFAAGTVLVQALVTFSEGGLRNTLVQRGGHIDDAADTVFWANLAFGAGWAALSVGAAPIIAWTFQSRDAALISMAMAGTIVLHAFTNVPEALLQRRFDLRQRVVVQPSVTGMYALSSVVLCLMGFGVWALVIASYLAQLVWIVSTWTLSGWRPGRGKASIRLWRELASFGFPMVLGSVADRGRDLFETTLVGSVLNTSILGQYRYGRRLASLPGTAVLELASYALFPAFSRVAADPVRLKRAFLRSLGALWTGSIPLAGLTLALGTHAVPLLLGERWSGAGVMFAALAGLGPGVALAAVGMESIKGCGRTRLINWITVYEIVVGCTLLVVMLRFGLLGVGIALSVTSLSAGLLSVFLAKNLARVSAGELTIRLIPPFVAATVAAIPVGIVEHTLIHSDQHGIWLGLLLLVSQVASYLAIYIALLALLAPSCLADLWSIVGRRPAER